jgi:hypothetical protein
MKKYITTFLSFLLGSSLLLPSIVTASNPNLPIEFSGNWYGQQNNVVEQQSDQHWPPDPLRYNPDWLHYVIDPINNCMWNADDNAQLIQVGRYVGAGQTVSGSYCKIADSHSAYVCINDQCASWAFSKAEAIGYAVTSPSKSLVVKLSWQPQNKVFTLTPVQIDRQTYRYSICVAIYYDKDDPLALQHVPGSNGSNDPNSVEGVGVVSSVTPSITNPTSKAIKGIAYELTALGASQVNDNVCTQGPPNYYSGSNREYPFIWY